MPKLLEGGYVWDYIGSIIGVTKGHANRLQVTWEYEAYCFWGYPKY